MGKYAIKVRERIQWEPFEADGCVKYVDEYAKRKDLPTGTILQVLNIDEEEVYEFEVARTIGLKYQCSRHGVDNKGIGHYDRMFNKFTKA